MPEVVYATAAEAVNKAITDKAISPMTLDHALQERWGHFSLRRNTEWDPTNITPALQKAIDDAQTAGGGTILIPSGSWQAKRKSSSAGEYGATFSSSNLFFFSDGFCRIQLHTDLTDHSLLESNIPGYAAQTTATVDIPLGSNQVTVASAAGIIPGHYLELTSSGEYWNGEFGNSGNRTDYKAERQRVKSVSGSVITLEAGTEDSYDCINFTVTVRAYAHRKRLGVANISTVGVGKTPAEKPNLLTAFRYEGVSLENLDWENNQNTLVLLNSSDYVSATGGFIRGYDLSIPSEADEWACGYSYSGTNYTQFIGIRGTGLRRISNLGAESSGRSIPCRHSIVANCIGEACGQLVGSHAAQDITFAGNTGYNAPIGSRARDVQFIGNKITMANGGTCTSLGNMDPYPCAERAENGRINFQHNILISSGRLFSIQQILRGGIFASNQFIKRGPGSAIHIESMEVYDVTFEGNQFSSPYTTDPEYAAINISRPPKGPRSTIRDIYSVGNTFSGFSVPIAVYGAADGNNGGAYNILSRGDTITDAGQGNLRTVMRLIGGCFGDNVGVTDAVIIGDMSAGAVVEQSAPHASAYAFAAVDHNNKRMPGSLRTVLRQDSATLPPLTSFRNGDCIERETLAVGQPRLRVCVLGGTTPPASGTTSWTGSMTSGSDLLTFATDPNLVTAGVWSDNMSSSTGWTVGAGWSFGAVTGGLGAKFTPQSGTGSYFLEKEMTGLTSGKFYRARVSPIDVTPANVCWVDIVVSSGDAAYLFEAPYITSNGAVTFYFKKTAGTVKIRLRPNYLFSGAIDQITVDEVDMRIFPGVRVNVPGAGSGGSTYSGYVTGISSGNPKVMIMKNAAQTTASNKTVTYRQPEWVGSDVTVSL